MFNNANITAQTQNTIIKTANPSRGGDGPMSVLFTAGTNGSYVTSITVKAQEATTPGMVRVFLTQNAQNILLEEFSIPSTEPSDTIESYQAMIVFPANGYMLAPGCSLSVSTQNAEIFNVIAEGFTWTY